MSTPTTLPATARSQSGTRACRRLRREGHVPAVIYGHGQDNTNISLPLKETRDALRHGAHVLSLDLDGGSEQVLIKDVQYDHLGLELLHMDLFRVNLDEEVTSEVPLNLVGEPAGAAEGGILTQMRDAIEVVCRVRNLPDEIKVDVSGLEVGDALHVNELKLPDGVKLPESDIDFTIAMIAAKKVRAADEEVATADGTEPEIIGDKATATQPGENAQENADQNA
jgi:large subunit ribosomal protein L25